MVAKAEKNPPLFWLHVTYIFLMLGGLIPMLFNGASDFRDFVDDRSPFVNVTYFSIHGIYLLLALLKPAKALGQGRSLLLPIAIVGLSFISAAYSEAAIRTVSLSGFLGLQIVACAYIFGDLTSRQFLDAAARACIIACVLSFLLIVFVPSYGRMTYVFPDAWQGIFTHKNALGRFATFSLIFIFAVRRYWRPRFWYAGMGMSLVLAIGSASATAYLVVLAIVLTLLALRSVLNIAIAAISAVVVYAILTISQLDVFTLVVEELFGRSATLSGRTTIWTLAIHYIGESPYVGYGLGGFWGTQEADNLRAAAGWFVPHAHNGFIEIGLQIGYVGIALFAAAMISATRTALHRNFTGDGYERSWPILFMAHSWIYGIAEANYLRPNAFMQVGLYAILCYGISEWSKVKRSKIPLRHSGNGASILAASAQMHKVMRQGEGNV